MRAKALILFIPFTLFFAEMLSFPTQVNAGCKKMSCMKMCQTKCSHKKDDCEKPDKCNNKAACTICPLCSIFTFQSTYFPFQNSFYKTTYPLLNKDDLSTFTSEVWKPPNRLFT